MNRATIKLVMSYTRQSLTGLESTMTCTSTFCSSEWSIPERDSYSREVRSLQDPCDTLNVFYLPSFERKCQVSMRMDASAYRSCFLLVEYSSKNTKEQHYRYSATENCNSPYAFCPPEWSMYWSRTSQSTVPDREVRSLQDPCDTVDWPFRSSHFWKEVKHPFSPQFRYL